MNNDLLVLIKNQTDTFIEQTKTTPQKEFEYKLKKQLDTFSFSPPINLIEEVIWLLSVTSFEA